VIDATLAPAPIGPPVPPTSIPPVVATPPNKPVVKP